MVSARPATVQLATRRDNIFRLQYNQLVGVSYKHDPANSKSISSNPLMEDPYESRMVEVTLCKDQSKGEGLFVRKSVPANTILAFYNGVKLEEKDCPKSEDWREDAYKIMDLLPTPGVLDIPLAFQSLANYCASLAHKANHSFCPNAKFRLFWHPRFGPVPAIESTVSIRSGGEVLVDYAYDFDESPPWFQDLQSQQLFEAYKQANDKQWETEWSYLRRL